MSNRMRRVHKELEDLRTDIQSGFSAFAIGDDISHLGGTFNGPTSTAYEGGTFQVDIKIPPEYPFKPPAMRFITKTWHPNISSQTGAICLDTLAAGWSPVLTLKSALQSLQFLLMTPEPKDPQDIEVARMLLQDPDMFESKAREWAVRYAGAPDPDKRFGDGSEIQEEEARHKADEERIRLLSYEGYPQQIFEQFLAMNFDVGRVVQIFKDMGIPKATNELSSQLIEEIIERLLS